MAGVLVAEEHDLPPAECVPDDRDLVVGEWTGEIQALDLRAGVARERVDGDAVGTRRAGLGFHSHGPQRTPVSGNR